MRLTKIRDSATIHLENVSNKVIAHSRRKQLNNTDFSIISNNCWGGHVYRRYGIPYQSPTVGLYFYSDDYSAFLDDLQTNIQGRLTFISYEESKHRKELIDRSQTNVPIGLINDKVEIVFLHYLSEKEAYEKWMRRCERVNYNNLIIKNSQMNGCTLENLIHFDSLPYKKKVAFVTK